MTSPDKEIFEQLAIMQLKANRIRKLVGKGESLSVGTARKIQTLSTKVIDTMEAVNSYVSV